MGLSLRVRTAAVVAATALAVPAVPWAAAGVVTDSPVRAPSSATPAGGPAPVGAPAPGWPTPSASVPSEADVARARGAAAAAAKEVRDITAKVALAQARLETLQRRVADAVDVQEGAAQQLAAADAAARQAAEDLTAADRATEDADRAVSARAAQMYMQGGDLQNLTTLLLSPTGVMSDLAVVLDSQADRVSENLDAATSAAQDAATRERLLTSARNRRAVAVEEARVKRTAAETEAAQAGVEAARLGRQEEVLSARLATLDKGAADLASLREAAARASSAALLGVQAAGGGAPRAAQAIAHSLVASYGWDEAEFACLVELWSGESGWSWSALNVSSGAYGIPQALPGWKMASAGSDWLTNPATQIAWGMGYIRSTYGSPCVAHAQWLARSPHWY